MPELSKDLLVLLQYLMPGFLSAWVFYGVCSYNKPSQFERVVQALIFTFVIKALVLLFETLLLFVGKYYSIAKWSSGVELFYSIFFAVLFGFVLAYFVEMDGFHRLLRSFKISNKSGYATEWVQAFNLYKRYIVINFSDGRRLIGWPMIWPTDSSSGHIFLTDYQWLFDQSSSESGDSKELQQSGECCSDQNAENRRNEAIKEVKDGILVNVKEIDFIDFLPETNV
ncbi:DUF6338 family protein [Chromobacterium haemolyticum]|uniref:DUF6338 family protein n=1 Tax=Chromobacterium haemolyticum TaxID=394935 RepID=UPI00405738CA